MERKKHSRFKKLSFLATVLGVSFVVTACSGEESVESDANTKQDSVESVGVAGSDLELSDLHERYTTIKGDGSDVYTIMVYMIGSDLESEAGFASNDLEEMLAAEFGDNVNLVVMTGGASSWQNENIRSDTCQYWQIKDGQMNCLEENLGLLNMASEETMTGFINYATQAMPANRYAMILWDHGGGTLSGYGYDENYPDSMLSLENLRNSFAASNIKFDFVGFDACLMGTAETALMMEPYADYLVASEELEPGNGWSYTKWLTALGEDSGMSTVDLGKNIIDSYVEDSCYEDENAEATLSIIELREMPYTYQKLCEYFSNAEVALQQNDYAAISTARSEVKAFGEGDVEQVDAIDFVNRAGIEGSDEVIAAINSAVKYHSNSPSIENSNGMAIYFPYNYLEYYGDVRSVLQNVGYTEDYTGFFNQFVSVMSSAQMTRGNADYSSADWYDQGIADGYADQYSMTDYSELVINEKGDDYVLQMTDEEWNEITTIELQVLLDDGEGYIDLGSDNTFEFDEDGDLLIQFDYTWVTLDGNTVPFYNEKEVQKEDGSWFTYGVVPTLRNGSEYIELVVYWDDKNPDGYVAGYRKVTEGASPVGKGLLQLQTGDQLEWLFDYYSYDWEYDDSYIVGDIYTVSDTPITVSYEDVGDLDAVVYFQLTDIYNNVYETEAVAYTD